jgi:AraC-like DNA-binding protein
MLLKDFLPIAPLREWIRCYRIVHFHFDEVPPVKPYTPRPEQCLAFYPYDTEQVSYPDTGLQIKDLRVVLIGQHSTVTQRLIGKDFLVIQVVFQPGGLYRILGIPAAEFNNQYIDGSMFFKSDIHLVNERLYHAKNYHQMVEVLDQYMLTVTAHAKKDTSSIELVMKYVQQIHSAYSIDYLATQSYYSLEQFERNFILRNGINPKAYQKLVRFDHAFRIKNALPESKWQDIAWQCKYSDYQHLSKDYKAFTGLTPAEFHSLDTPEQSLGMAEGFYELELREV